MGPFLPQNITTTCCLLSSIVFCVLGCFACIHVCAPNAYLVPAEVRKYQNPEARVADGCELPHGHGRWESKPGPIRGQQELFTLSPAPNFCLLNDSHSDRGEMESQPHWFLFPLVSTLHFFKKKCIYWPFVLLCLKTPEFVFFPY